LTVSTKKQKAVATRKKAAVTAKARTGQVTGTQLPRPRVTEFAAVAVVPVLPGTADKPAGSQGLYDIVFVLGVPGVSSVDDRQLSGAQLGDLVPCSGKRAVSRRCCAAAVTSAAVCQVRRRIEIMQAG
jgi:hypothetical protein